MIKLVLTVDNENIEKNDLIRALNANNAYLAISEIEEIFRSIIKWGVVRKESLTGDQIELVEKIRNMVYEAIDDLPGRF